MQMLRQDTRKKIRVYVLNPDYVKKNVPQDGAIARASKLYGFDVNSWFIAEGRDVGNLYGLHGVRRVVAEGDAVKNISPLG